jgi:hypothetical protein
MIKRVRAKTPTRSAAGKKETPGGDQDRRRLQRFTPTLRVRTEVIKEKSSIHMAVFADIVNLSEEGIGLRSPLKLEIRDRIIIFLPRLDQALPYVIHGRVVWTKAFTVVLFDYGMKFSDIPKDQEEKVHLELKDIINSYYDQRSITFAASEPPAR